MQINDEKSLTRMDTTGSSTDSRTASTNETAPRYRIWVAHCAFKKNGFPSLGSFGYTSDDVVILKMATWKRLCEDVPALKTTQFEVGSEE